MSRWPSAKAKLVLKALLKKGWTVKRQSGSHRVLKRPGWPDFVFAFHDKEEIGPKMLARIAKHTGLNPKDQGVGLRLLSNLFPTNSKTAAAPTDGNGRTILCSGAPRACATGSRRRLTSARLL